MGEVLVEEPRGSAGLVEVDTFGMEAIEIGRALERGREHEKVIAGIIHPRYKLAGDLVNAMFELQKKQEEAGKKRFNEVVTEIKKLRDQIEEEPERASEIVKEIAKLRAEKDKLSKKIKENTTEEKKAVKDIKEAIKEKDRQAVTALLMLGYQL